jgi:hypothetical protein
LIRSSSAITGEGRPHRLVVAHLDGTDHEYWAVMSESYETFVWPDTLECMYTNTYVVQNLIGKEVSDEELRRQFGCEIVHIWIGVDE